MNWIATNIRFPEDQYMKLKMKAAQERKSVAAVIREAADKITEPKQRQRKIDVKKFMEELDKLAEEISRDIPRGFDSTKALREIRYKDE